MPVASIRARARVNRSAYTTTSVEALPEPAVVGAALRCIACCAMEDEKRQRLAAWLEGSGIEIGALHQPLQVPLYTHVRYVDRLTVDEQRRHYPELAQYQLAPVDIIATADDLSVIDESSVDFVIANHLLEHIEDPITALCEFQRVLRPGGVVYLALPDKRLSFDRDRELTSVEHLLREHDEGPGTTRREHYLDWTRHVVRANPEDVENHAERLMADSYSIHFHCWDPDTFLDFFVAARQKMALDFAIAAFAPPERPDDGEFILILVKGRYGDPPQPPTPSTRLRWRRRLATSPLGPPVRAAKRALRSLPGVKSPTDTSSSAS
jgi:predicted SAM-dependent methyltransferase